MYTINIEGQNCEVFMWDDRTNSEILEILNSKVTGHIAAKKSLITAVKRSKLRAYQKWGLCLGGEDLIATTNVLLIGGSGTGKTFLFNTLKDIMDFPSISVDATAFNPTGASGGIKAETLRKMIIKEAEDLITASPAGRYFSVGGVIDQMIVFVDEIDKLGHSWESSGRWQQQVQANFLTLFDNYSDLSGVTFVFAGAFTGIETPSTAEKTSIGFFSVGTGEEKCLDTELVSYGLIPELVGRIGDIVKLDIFTRETYRKILLDTLLPKKQKDLQYYGCDTFYLDEVGVNSILDSVKDSGQGVRALKRALNRYALEFEFNSHYVPIRTNEKEEIKGLQTCPNIDYIWYD